MTPRYPTTDTARNLPKLPTHAWCQAIASISQFFLLGVLPPPSDLCVFTQVPQLQVSVLFFFPRQLYLTPPKTSADLDTKHIALLQLELLFCVLMVSLQDSRVSKGMDNLDHGLQHRAKSSPYGGYRMLLWYWVFINVLVHSGCYHKHTGQFIGNKKNMHSSRFSRLWRAR